MWKLMIFGVIVQLVLLVSILDVNVYDDGGSIQFLERKPCIRNLMVIVIEGLQFEDVLLAMNKSESARRMLPTSTTYQVVSSSNHSLVGNSSASIFDDKQVLYVGPPATPYAFNTSLWDFILLNDEENNATSSVLPNGTEILNYTSSSALLNESLVDEMTNYGTYMVSNHKIIDHVRKIIESQQLDFYPVKFVNIGPKSAYDESMSPVERAWFLSKVFQVISRTVRSSTYVFAISSTISMLVENSTDYEMDDSLIIYGNLGCISETFVPFFNDTLNFDQAYNKLRALVALTSFKREVPLERHAMVNYFTAEGNLLDFIGFRAFQKQKMYKNIGLYFTGWETLTAVFNSLDFVETKSNSMITVSTVLIFLMWIGYLSFKTLKLAVDTTRSRVEASSTMLKLLNVCCLILLAILLVASRSAGYPCRYLIYFSTAILVLRLFFGELLSPDRPNILCSNSDKVKVGLQLFILVGVVECLFWSIVYKKILFIVFVMAVSARIFQGAISVIHFKTITAFSASSFFVGLQYLWSYQPLGQLVNLNVSATLWLIGGIVVIKFLMDKSNHDRFLMFICLVELVMATSFANVFIVYGFSAYSVVPIVGFFMSISLILPLFGSVDTKNRLLELAVATAAVYVFFSCHGEGLFLLASFAASFCSYMMDRASAEKLSDDDSYYINIFPALFHTVLLILACHVVTPTGGESIIRAYTLLSDTPYQLLASGIFYFLKLAFLVNLLEATFLSTGQRLMELPNLFIVVIILNLISFRAFIQYSIFSYNKGRKLVYINHILMHVLAALSFYLQPFIQALCSTNLFSLCKTFKTYIPQESIH